MSADKHTPGPWVEGTSSGAIVAECPTPEDCRECNEGAADFYGGHIVCESARAHNRPLLKSAPDLLAALESAPEPPNMNLPPREYTARSYEFQAKHRKWHETIRAAALAKARGKP